MASKLPSIYAVAQECRDARAEEAPGSILADRERVKQMCAQAAEDAVANGVIVCSAAEVGNFVRGIDIIGRN